MRPEPNSEREQRGMDWLISHQSKAKISLGLFLSIKGNKLQAVADYGSRFSDRLYLNEYQPEEQRRAARKAPRNARDGVYKHALVLLC